jgi:hypothetical protein
LREQTETEGDGGRRELDIARNSLSSLVQDIKDIKEKAEHAEQTVQDITKDIKSLDCAKKNMISSITILKRLQMMSSAVDQLHSIMTKRQYAEMSRLIPAVVQLSGQFKSYRNIKQISDLLDRTSSLLTDVKRLIFSEFEGSFTPYGQLTGNVSSLQEACLVLDVLEGDGKKQFLDWYCELLLKEYRSVFRPSDEVGNFENLTRRFTKFQKIIRMYDEEQAAIFPKSWNVSELLSERFCSTTKDDVHTLLSKSPNIDVKLLISNLTETLKFEASLNRRFSTIRQDETGGQSALQTPTIFNGKISSSFEPFMKVYLDVEDKALALIIEKSKSQNKLAEDEGVLSASLDLFNLYRQTLKSMAELNTGKPFLELSKIFGKYLVAFCEVLSSKIPKEEKRAATAEEIKLTCFLLNTVDFCFNTIMQLEDKLKEKCDAEYKDQISLNSEREMFLVAATNAVQALVREVNSCVYVAVQSMTKIPWSTFQAVGDQSEYVSMMSNSLFTNVKLIRKIVRSPKHFKWFCDKFVDSFVPWFRKNIFNCKPISEAGAEQLLLDTMAIKTLLLELPNMGAEEKQPVSAVYTRFVNKGISKVETLLKVVLTPLDPPEGIIKNYLILYVEASADEDNKKEALTVQKIAELRENLVKVLDLKGVKKQDQQVLVDLLNSRLSSNRGAAVPSLLAQLAQSPVPTNTAAHATQAALSSFATGLAQLNQQTGNTIKTSVNDAGAKISDSFKKWTSFTGSTSSPPKK